MRLSTRRPKSSLSATKASRRSSCWFGTSKVRSGTSAMASTRRSEEKTRASSWMPRGKSQKVSARGSLRKVRLSASATLSKALKGTDSRS